MNKKRLKITLCSALLTASFGSNAALPGMQGPQHFGFTVPNLKEAIAFYEEVIGCESFFSIGPFGPFEDDWMTVNLNVNSAAVIKSAHLMRCGNGTNFEIFEYTSPDQVTTYPANSDYGASHIAFYVDDIDDAVDYLKSKGVKVLGEPKTFTDTGMKGLSWVYFLAPWGQQLEILSYPNGQGYEQTTHRRLWDPRD